MKARKVLLSAVVVVLLAAAGAAWWLYTSLDGLVKQAIEHWGPQITGVAVEVDSVRIEVAQGRGTIRGLVVGNPQGFATPQALKLGEMRLTLDPASVARDVVIIRELLLVAPEVAYERGQGSDNMTVIQRNVDAWVATNAGSTKKDAGPGKKFVIENLVIRDGKANFGVAGTTMSSPMPGLHLRDVGKKAGGATAGEVVKQVWGAMLRSASNLFSRAGANLKEAGKSIGQSVPKLFK